MKYQRAVFFEVQGIRGHVDQDNWVIFGNTGFHLEDISIESPVRQAIHKVRNGEWKASSPIQFHFGVGVTI